MKKLFLMLALLATFASCNQHKQIKLHSYITTDDDGILYWYLLYGQNDMYYTYSSRIPVTDFIDVAWNTSSSIPSSIALFKFSIFSFSKLFLICLNSIIVLGV